MGVVARLLRTSFVSRSLLATSSRVRRKTSMKRRLFATSSLVRRKTSIKRRLGASLRRHEQEIFRVDTLDVNYIPYIPYTAHKFSKIESGPDYIIAAHAFAKATLRLGLRPPLVARKKRNELQNNFPFTKNGSRHFSESILGLGYYVPKDFALQEYGGKRPGC